MPAGGEFITKVGVPRQHRKNRAFRRKDHFYEFYIFRTAPRAVEYVIAVQLSQHGFAFRRDKRRVERKHCRLARREQIFQLYVHFRGDFKRRIVHADQEHIAQIGAAHRLCRAAGEALAKERPDKRTLLYSRSSFIGSHRYGGIWLGDNNSSWGQLLANIQMMPNVQMCGFLYTGADLCGFGYDTTPDLALRWLEFGILTPLMRNHSSSGTRAQEYYQFEDELPAIRKMLQLRYALLPYLYSEFMKAALENGSYFRPLAFDYPGDPDAREVQDQLLLGEGLMAAPVYTQNAHGRMVYLPESMKLFRLRAADDHDEEILPAGHHYVRCGLDEVLLFVRPGHLVPVASPADNTAQLDDTKLNLWSYLPDGAHASYRMYTDDGVTTDYEKPEHWRTLTL